MKLFQWVAYGPNNWTGEKVRIHSRRVFFSPEHAEEGKQAFIDACLTGIFCIDEVREIKLLELELEE